MADADDFDVEYFKGLLKGEGGKKEARPPAAAPPAGGAKPKRAPAKGRSRGGKKPPPR